MNGAIHQPHDKLFKVSLTEKKVAIDYLKAYVPAEIYKHLNVETLELTDKSFILPKFRAIHADIVYRCQIDNEEGYIFFILEAESTANEEFMPFRQLQYSIAAMDQHIQQGHKKLPIVLPVCLYHGETSPYPHKLDIYEYFYNPSLAKQIIFKLSILIDLTVISDDELIKTGRAYLMQTLLKHARAKDFLSILNLRRAAIREVLIQLNRETRRFMLKYVINETQDEEIPNAVELLIQTLIIDFPEEKKTIMTFAQQLEHKGRQQGLEQGLKQGLKQGLERGLEQGEQRRALHIAKKMLGSGHDHDYIKGITGLSDQDLLNLQD